MPLVQRQTSGSLTVTISKDAVDALELKKGDEIKFRVTDSGEVKVIKAK